MRHIVDSVFSEALKSVVMNSATNSSDLRHAIHQLGQEIAKNVIEKYFLSESKIMTPMGVEVTRLSPVTPLCAIVTTKDDFSSLGLGMATVLTNSIAGYMDFQGRRGLQALNAKIQNAELPDVKGQPVDTLLIAKAVLATGCTATNLTRSAVGKYMPRRIIIASLFYSVEAIAELQHEIPNADILVIGHPDILNSDGMLVPGVGLLDKRLNG